MRVQALLLSFLLASPAWAGKLELDGHFQQGGLVFGTTEPGASVTLGEREVRVSPQGRFVIGFGYDAPPRATLAVRFPDGSTEQRTLQVEKRTYRVQRIDGLPRKMVTPPESEWPRIEAENARIAAARAVDRPEALFESGFV